MIQGMILGFITTMGLASVFIASGFINRGEYWAAAGAILYVLLSLVAFCGWVRP